MENQAPTAEALNSNHSDLINTFTEITSSSKEEALFFLESHNFDLDSAVSTFLETTVATADADAVAVSVSAGRNHSPSPSLSPPSSPSRSRSPSPPPPLRPQSSSLYNLRSRLQNQPSADKRPSGSRAGRIHTFSDLNRTAGGDSGSDSDEPRGGTRGGWGGQLPPVAGLRQAAGEQPSCKQKWNQGGAGVAVAPGIRTPAGGRGSSRAGAGGSGTDEIFCPPYEVALVPPLDEPQEYYTGGEKSGMLVQDPSKANDVDALFNQARQAGAVEGQADHRRPSSSSRSFSGTARLLSGETLSSAPLHPEAVTHNITFWSNGFTIDDGPLRRLDDPENASFLESIRKSECPKELEPADRKTAVHVNLMRKEEDCPAPQKRQDSFQGLGRTLGSTNSAIPPAEPTVAASNLHTAPLPSVGLVVDQALPSTSIQLRLADGTRMVSRFNYHHTIRDIRGFIDASRPAAPRTYQLQTVGFPPKQLNNLDQTIEQAGLANSVVIQKL